jgi:hypothetical protein
MFKETLVLKVQLVPLVAQVQQAQVQLLQLVLSQQQDLLEYLM